VPEPFGEEIIDEDTDNISEGLARPKASCHFADTWYLPVVLTSAPYRFWKAGNPKREPIKAVS